MASAVGAVHACRLPTLSLQPKLNRKSAKNAKLREEVEVEAIIRRASLGGPSRSLRLCGFAFLLA
jgi:hypothetical protein